jgi:hypothetical protein
MLRISGTFRWLCQLQRNGFFLSSQFAAIVVAILLYFIVARKIVEIEVFK